MSHRSRDDVYDPFCELSNGLSIKQQYDISRAESWAYYLNGGGGDPRYFDFEGYVKMHRHERER